MLRAATLLAVEGGFYGDVADNRKPVPRRLVRQDDSDGEGAEQDSTNEDQQGTEAEVPDAAPDPRHVMDAER